MFEELSRISNAKYFKNLLQVLKQLYKMLEFDITRSLDLHDVNQNITQSDVVLLHF